MKKLKNIISLLLCAVLIASLFSACSSKTAGIDLIYPFNGDINSYDPQVASTTDEYLVAENCFEGLVRSDDDGKITPGCATTWDVSDDGLQYTFHIQKGLHWYIYESVKDKFGEDYNPEITANDFVFGLRRAADSETNSPLFSTISSIENATAIHNGSKNKDELGVKAVDNYTLQINLDEKDGSFLKTLSTSIAMPCNEEFFNSTNGRYGLDLKYTLFNGQFIITNQLDASYILKKSKTYAGPTPAIAEKLTLNIIDKDTSVVDKLISGYYDAAYIRGYESTEISNKNKITLNDYSDRTWSFVLNSQSGILSSKKARHAFALAFSDIETDKYDYLSKAKGLIPPSCTVGTSSYTANSENVVSAQDQDKAISLWKEAISATGIYSIEITVIAPDYMESQAKELIQGVQSSIGSVSTVNQTKVDFTFKLETKTESELMSSVSAGKYDIALYPYRAISSSPVSFLQSISSNNITSFTSTDFDSDLSDAESANSADLTNACVKCEKDLIDTYCYVPLFYESSYYAEAKGVSNVQFHAGTGRVSFIYANRAD